jgi:hypothetical protein
MVRQLVIWSLFMANFVNAQTRAVTHANQYWVGYITATQLSEKYAVWNDVHVVPQAFAIVRTGLTRTLSNNVAATAGYAYLWLPIKVGSDALRRNEHRPWAQLQFNAPLSKGWSFTQRTRYDARFRENIRDGEVVDGYAFNHRVRFLISIKRVLGDAQRSRPYLGASNETLLNFGKEVASSFDQNRLMVFAGIQHRQVQYQLGLMNRYVQTGPSKFALNHTVVVWVVQKFDLRKLRAGTQGHEMTSE